MKHLTVEELAERLAQDPRVRSVRIEEERSVRSMTGTVQVIESSLTISMSRRDIGAEDQWVVEPAILKRGEDGLVIGATLNVSKPYWAVEAVRRALGMEL